MTKTNGWALALVATAALAACGGGSDTPVAPSAVTIAGTAAKGAALAGAAVSIKCAAGTGTATTGADGKYSVTITGANLPCALKVAGTEGSVFHSVLAGTGTTGTFAANITPLTEMLLAKVAGAAPAAFFAGLGSGTVVSAASLTQGLDYLKTALAGATDLTGVNPVIDPLTIGNALDQKIDAVMAALASAGVTLAEVTTTIVANPNAPAVIGAPLAPPASDCTWLRSGKYRMINPAETDARWKAHVLTVDAATKTFRDQDSVPGSLTPAGACRYTINDTDATHTVMVSSSGVLVVHSQSTTVATSRAVAIGLPEQLLPLTELAGTWHLAVWNPTVVSTGTVAQTGEATIDASGQITAMVGCQGLAACSANTGPFVRFAANAGNGGFDMFEGAAAIGRGFMFKNLAGRAALMYFTNDGEWGIATRKAALGALPAVGTVSNFRQILLNGNGSIAAWSEDSTTVTAIDATAKTTTRLLASNNRVDMLTYDKPRDGLRYRAPNSCTINGAANNCAEVVQLPLQGMGITLTMSVSTNPATSFFQASIGKPN